MKLRKFIFPLLSLISFGVLGQSESINAKIKTEETFKVVTAKKKRYTYFPQNAPITMADGAVAEISLVRVGDYVQAFKKGKRTITKVTQIDVYNYPSSALTAVYLRPANETTASSSDFTVQALLLEASPHHQVQTVRGRKMIKNLSKKDVLYHFEPATGELSSWKVGAIQQNVRTVNKAYNLKTEEGSYLVENLIVN
jgi:hypothetical protein